MINCVSIIGSTSPPQTAPPPAAAIEAAFLLLFGLVFTGTAGLSFTVLSTTNLSLANWLAVGATTETYPGVYEFSQPEVKNTPQIYYRIIAQ